MKKLLGLLLLLTGTSAWAAGVPSLTYQVGVSSIVTRIVSVSNTTPGVDVDTPTLVGRVAIEIDNIDATANLWCLPVSSSTQVVAASAGRKIAAGATWVVSVADAIQNPGFPATRTTVPVWCISDGAGSTKAAVTQLY